MVDEDLLAIVIGQDPGEKIDGKACVWPEDEVRSQPGLEQGIEGGIKYDAQGEEGDAREAGDQEETFVPEEAEQEQQEIELYLDRERGQGRVDQGAEAGGVGKNAGQLVIDAEQQGYLPVLAEERV